MLKSLNQPATEQRLPISGFVKYKKRNFYGLPSQRGYVWNNESKSKLVQFIIGNYSIGTLCVNVIEGKYRFMDGHQRGKTLTGLFKDEFIIDEEYGEIEIPISEDQTKIFYIGGKKFSEFDKEVQEIIKNRIIVIEIYNNLSLEQEANIIDSRNSGKSPTKTEKTIMNTHRHVQPFVTETINHNFFNKIKASIPSKEGKLFDSIVHRIIDIELGLPTGFHTGILLDLMVRVDRLSMIDEEMKSRINDKLDYLDKAFPERPSSCLGHNNPPLAYAIVEHAMDDKIPPLEFGGIVQRYVDDNGIAVNSTTLEYIKKEIKNMELYYDNHKGKGLVYKLKPLRSRNR